MVRRAIVKMSLFETFSLKIKTNAPSLVCWEIPGTPLYGVWSAKVWFQRLFFGD